MLLVVTSGACVWPTFRVQMRAAANKRWANSRRAASNPIVGRDARPRRPAARRMRLALALLLLPGCGYEHMQGRSMGTTYSVQGNCALPRGAIDALLARVNRQMSTYDAHSELSIFNRAAVGEAVPVSSALVEVVAAAQELSVRTSGAFDATVAPLVGLWGFGAQAATSPPTAAQVRAALAQVGYRKVRLRRQPPRLRKRAQTTLDLSAIAKGYAVDEMARLLRTAGCDAFLVELGGELRTAGSAPGGGRWRVAVESPANDRVLTTLRLRDGAVATAGDYRQRRLVDGVPISHVIDPRTGHPLRHDTASVTVVATTTLEADGLATALLVMGAGAGAAFAEEHRIAALFVVRQNDGLALRASRALAAYRSASSGKPNRSLTKYNGRRFTSP